MSGLTLNGIPVLEATFSIPRIGAWSIEASVHSEDDITGRVLLASTDESSTITWGGTVLSSQRFNDTVKLRIAPGAGGLSKRAKAKHHTNNSVGVVVQGLLSTAGETLDGSSSIPGHSLESWTVSAGSDGQPNTIGSALRGLLEHEAGLTWRALPSGTIWVGRESWPGTLLGEHDFAVIDRDGQTGVVHYQLERPELLPGTVIDGDRLGHVEIRLDQSGISATGQIDRGGGSPVLDQWQRMIKGALPDLDHRAGYWARIDGQSADGATVDVTPEDPRMPTMRSVPLIVGEGGSGSLVTKGARCLIGWSAGDPSQRYAIGIAQGAHATKHWTEADMVALGGRAATDPVTKALELMPILSEAFAALGTGFTAIAALTLPVSGATAGPPPNAQAFADLTTQFTALAARLQSIASTKVFVDK